MKRISILGLILCTCLVSAAMALSASAQGNGALPAGQNSFAGVMIINSERTVLHDDIVHYRYTVVVGPGPFDRIGLHRVVKESHPYWPAKTVDGVLLVGGSPNSFDMIFLEPSISSVPAWDHSIAVFLAKNGIDVWGTDYRWALVPAGTTDFNFMKGWGLEKDIQDTKIALSLARLLRGSTGQGFGQLHLLGFSYGVDVAYGVANQESQEPNLLRNVKGIIPVDYGINYPDGSPIQTASCDGVAANQALLDAGVYNDTSGVFFEQVGDLARSAPNDQSPFMDGVTNYEFALFAGASAQPPPEGWHFVGGYFNDSGITTDLRYTDPWLWIDVLRAVPPYLPVRVDLDDNAAEGCNGVVAPFDDHLGDIAVPILYVGAGGGTGKYGYYTTTLTASKDITKFTVQLQPDDQRAVDFGHADLFMARDAETLVWKPILDWLVAHR